MAFACSRPAAPTNSVPNHAELINPMVHAVVSTMSPPPSLVPEPLECGSATLGRPLHERSQRQPRPDRIALVASVLPMPRQDRGRRRHAPSTLPIQCAPDPGRQARRAPALPNAGGAALIAADPARGVARGPRRPARSARPSRWSDRARAMPRRPLERSVSGRPGVRARRARLCRGWTPPRSGERGHRRSSASTVEPLDLLARIMAQQ